MYVGFKTSFYVVQHLDSTASYLPTGLHLGFFRSWPSLHLPSLCLGFFSMCFYRVMGCWPIDPTPNLEDQCISLCLGALLWPVRVALPGATLPPAYLSGSSHHASLITRQKMSSSRWRYFKEQMSTGYKSRITYFSNFRRIIWPTQHHTQGPTSAITMNGGSYFVLCLYHQSVWISVT